MNGSFRSVYKKQNQSVEIYANNWNNVCFFVITKKHKLLKIQLYLSWYNYFHMTVDYWLTQKSLNADKLIKEKIIIAINIHMIFFWYRGSILDTPEKKLSIFTLQKGRWMGNERMQTFFSQWGENGKLFWDLKQHRRALGPFYQQNMKVKAKLFEKLEISCKVSSEHKNKVKNITSVFLLRDEFRGEKVAFIEKNWNNKKLYMEFPWNFQ